MSPHRDPAQESGIVISFADMYGEIQKIARSQAEQGGTLKEINTKLDQVVSATEDHESRIRTLEKKVWGASGAAGLLGGLISYLATIFR